MSALFLILLSEINWNKYEQILMQNSTFPDLYFFYNRWRNYYLKTGGLKSSSRPQNYAQMLSYVA